MLWRMLMAGLTCIGICVCTVDAGDTFYLRSTKTDRRYGPFTNRVGSTIHIGGVTFAVEPYTPPPVDPPVVRPNPPVVDAKDSADTAERPVVNAEPSPLTPAEEKAALSAAQGWLLLIDAGQYEDAWRRASPLLQQSITQEEFTQAVTEAFRSIGVVIERDISAMFYASAMPSAPKGDYLIIELDSEMTRKPRGKETIIPVRDNDGVWRVSGYTVD